MYVPFELEIAFLLVELPSLCFALHNRQLKCGCRRINISCGRLRTLHPDFHKIVIVIMSILNINIFQCVCVGWMHWQTISAKAILWLSAFENNNRIFVHFGINCSCCLYAVVALQYCLRWDLCVLVACFVRQTYRFSVNVVREKNVLFSSSYSSSALTLQI